MLDEKSREYEALHIAYLERQEDIEQGGHGAPWPAQDPYRAQRQAGHRGLLPRGVENLGIRGGTMEEYKIKRINELAKKAREQGLTPEETDERDALRREYIESVKQNLRPS